MSLPRDIELAGYPGEAHLQVKPIWPNPGTEAAMTRRMLVLLTAIAFLGSVSSAGAFPKHPITEWIRDLYTAQASRIAQSESLEDADFVALFTPEVVELWLARASRREGKFHRRVESARHDRGADTPDRRGGFGSTAPYRPGGDRR
jgi:hypothetical protein